MFAAAIRRCVKESATRRSFGVTSSALTAATPRVLSSSSASKWNSSAPDAMMHQQQKRCLSSPAANTTSAVPGTAAPGTATDILSSIVADIPTLDVVRYHHKNRTWTAYHVEYYSAALAYGFLETGLQKGDVILSWLPEHFAEQMVLQFACAKAGMILYTLDPALAITDRAGAKEALAQALRLTKANILISQESGSDVPYHFLAENVIPEIRIFCPSEGGAFVTPRFPHLRFCIHTGFDNSTVEPGWYRYKHFIVPAYDHLFEAKIKTVDLSTPLAGELALNAKGIPTGIARVLTHEQVLKEKIWPTFSKILEREFHEVEGVGVVF